MNSSRSETVCALLGALLCTTGISVQAQFTFTTNNGAITITKYTGLGGNVVIPDTTNGYPVTAIGEFSFNLCRGLTSVQIPDSVTSIGEGAFSDCEGLGSIIIPDRVTSIGRIAFLTCLSLDNVVIGNSVTNIGDGAFHNCVRLRSVIVPNSVISIGNNAFYWCPNMTNVVIGKGVASIGEQAFYCGEKLHNVYFKGNAPSLGGQIFLLEYDWGYFGTAYYLPGTTGWGQTFGGWPTAPWYQSYPQIMFPKVNGGGSNGAFEFTVSWATNSSVVAEASSDLSYWTPIGTNTLIDGVSHFIDPGRTNHPQRFYRARTE